MDLSETCGYSIEQQAHLFKEIAPLFANKPVVIVINKIDRRRIDDLSAEEKAVLDGMIKAVPGAAAPIPVLQMSTYSDEGVADVKNSACELLLQYRIDSKMAKKATSSDVLQRIHLAVPKPRDGVQREAFIPESVLAQRSSDALIAEKRLARDLEREGGGPGRYVHDLKVVYDLANPEWKYDVIPEIMDGHNVADFVDADILAQLDALEEEEGMREAAEDDEDEVVCYCSLLKLGLFISDGG
jgi:nucleolar GTP-binding protein